MVLLKSKQEIDIMRKVNSMIAGVREELRAMIEPGISTLELDQEAESRILKLGGKPAFKGYRGFPSTLCIALNEVVVHGIPSKRKLKDGDLVGLDMGIIYDDYYGDTAFTMPVGNVTNEAKKLMKTTEESLYKGIEAAQPGGHLHDIGAAVQGHVEKEGYSIVKDFVGHGIGKSLHEDPQVPNYGRKGTGMKLQPGLVVAIEPMVNEGTPDVRILADGWTAVTADGRLSAHFEHSIAITEDGPEILTTVH